MSTNGTAAASPLSVHVKDQFELTVREKLIFDRLLDVLLYFNLHTQLRVAGGWVRDKLLGKDPCDIDIALDNMWGREFCEKVEEYYLEMGEETGRTHVTRCNPNKSKHLETAKMCLYDVSIDFVNLRAEDYCCNSRIPTMRFGTAEEDAYRRDLTINSLFYNINTNSVEDFTGRGITDLKSGKIVTPLPPKKTFLDDPLRVLRAIRFAVRFGFTLDEDLKKAAADDDVKAVFAIKISRERIGHEIDLMMSRNQPLRAMSYIADLQLFWSVFCLPAEFEPSISEGCDRLCLSYIDSSWRLLEQVGLSSFTDEQRRLCLYAALFLPFRRTVYRDNDGKNGPVVSYIICNSLKRKSRDDETVVSLHKSLEKFVSLVPLILAKDGVDTVDVDWKKETIDVPNCSKVRVLAGLLVREIKDFWRAALVLSMLLYPHDIACSEDSAHTELVKRGEYLKAVEDAILELGLGKVWALEDLVDGNDIMSALQLETDGPHVGEWKQKVLEWQLAYPSGTAEECIDWLRETCKNKEVVSKCNRTSTKKKKKRNRIK